MSFLAAALIAATCSEYAGRYERPSGDMVIVECRGETLTARPVLWRSLQTLRPDGADRFVVAERSERSLTFVRENGRIVEVRTSGIGSDEPARRRTSPEPAAAELLMMGDGRGAARLFGGKSVENAIALSDFIVNYVPTRAAAAADFLDELRVLGMKGAALDAAFGDAAVAAGRRDAALAALTRAQELDRAKTSLRMLRGNATGSGWTLPFSLDALFAPPTDEERAAVLRRWSERDLRPRDVEVVANGTMTIGATPFVVRIVSHRVFGSKHYGAILIPEKPSADCCGVIVEAKGVSPSYFPLDLANAPYAPRFMADDAARFIYVLPSYRGETLIFNGTSYTSEGDRTDVWDGATDDALALLAVALKNEPRADASRVCAFGKSRGGAVALLAGIRNPNIRCVVAWSAPTDHFAAMVQSGWTPRERLVEGLTQQSKPSGMAGQFIETFLRHAIAGSEDLRDVRLRLIASSAAWFADRLPETQAQYGRDDNMVSTRNGDLLRNRPRVSVIEYDAAGHDLNEAEAFAKSRRFILDHLSR